MKSVKKSERANKKSARVNAKVGKSMKYTSTYILRTSAKIMICVAAIALTYFLCTKAYAFGNAVFSEQGMEEEGKDVVVTIPAGSTTKEVANILKDNGLIEDVNVFLIQAKLYEGDFYSGTFTLNTSYNPEEIVQELSKTPGTEKETTAS